MGDHRPGAADRVRERDQSAAGAHRRPSAGDRDPRRARCRPRAASRASGCSRASSWRSRAASLGLGLAFAALRLLVLIGPESLPRLRRDRHRSHGRRVRRGRLDRVRTLVRHHSRLPAGRAQVGLALGAPDAVQQQPRAAPDAEHARRPAGRAGAGAAGCLRPDDADFLALRAVEPGFTAPEHVQLVRVAIPETLDREPGARGSHAAAPSATTSQPSRASPPPPSPAPRRIEGVNRTTCSSRTRPSAQGELPPIRRLKLVAPGFFGASGSADRRPRPHVDRHLSAPAGRDGLGKPRARKLAGAAAAIGQRIRENPTGPWREIVGVVGDVHDDGMQEPAPPIVYWPRLMENFWGNPVQIQRAVTSRSAAIRRVRTCF